MLRHVGDRERNLATLVEIHTLEGLKEFLPGDDLGLPIVRSAKQTAGGVLPCDIIVITQKIVSKCEDMIVDLKSVIPTDEANRLAHETNKDPRLVQLILSQSKDIIRVDKERGILITETHHGFICANAGIDSSNVPGDTNVCLLPADPDESARRIRVRILELIGDIPIAVIISDTFGRPWREGHLNFAIGSCGIEPIRDYRATVDAVGKSLKVTMIAIADMVAAASDLGSGKATNTPVAIVRGVEYQQSPYGASSLLRSATKDMFR